MKDMIDLDIKEKLIDGGWSMAKVSRPRCCFDEIRESQNNRGVPRIRREIVALKFR